MALGLYKEAEEDLYEFMKKKEASHYKRLTSFGLEKDIRHCLTSNTANVLPLYTEGKLIRG
jgi:2-phosphosulfolactate phosphatase